MAEWDYIVTDPLGKLLEALRALPRYSATLAKQGVVMIRPCVMVEDLDRVIQQAIAPPVEERKADA